VKLKATVRAVICLLPLFGACQIKAPDSPNVLFIAVDDLRPELGCYGNDIIKTPSMDRLASEGCVFTQHFVSAPTCGASRYGLLTGLRPSTRAEIGNDAVRTVLSEKSETERPESFVHHLRRNGYYTVGIGKISHYPDGLLYGYEEPPSPEREMPHSWDEMLLDTGKWGTGWNAFFAYADGSNRQSRRKEVKPYESAAVSDSGYPDGLTANLAVSKLRELEGSSRPFFLGVGFFKPHLPFTAPQKYWDMYDRSDIPVSLSDFLPHNVHRESLHLSGEFNQYKLGEEKASLDAPVSEDYARKLRHAYFACVSYVDAQIGKVLGELQRLGLRDNTIVMIWGDHGWHLGDHLVWGKHTLFERALRSVLIVSLPGDASQGIACNRVISTLDIYPTLMELCGLDIPYKTEGRSFKRLLQGQAEKESDWEDLAFSYYKRGISLRTDRYRLTRYFREEEPALELYDHHADPFEHVNIAPDHPQVVERLLRIWKRGDTGLYEK
jgi:arylsulfatase A-like enzyme